MFRAHRGERHNLAGSVPPPMWGNWLELSKGTIARASESPVVPSHAQSPVIQRDSPGNDPCIVQNGERIHERRQTHCTRKKAFPLIDSLESKPSK